MLNKWQYNLLTALGVAALVLAIANAALFSTNRGAQAELAQRQQFVQQTGALDGLYRDIVKALAEVAVKGNDKQILDLLSAQGLSVTVNKPEPATPAAAKQGDK